ncbi:arylamine N-acetyltransferase family protein [Novosphingobium sp. 9]|uniref:arylamine N-acetyltransferase family protein n=1 Tax=Novosphingobium sp. 9 TaxID=2025349 RepID=UPI0021B6A8E7|nr:arylamine N-acetyltransferase [Novosphingobium sp. 9]
MDLSRYLSRIGLAAAPSAGVEGLALLQAAHRQTIGFENLDIPLGRPILIDSASVFDKLVVRGRGGYCFEQNRLFSDVLTALGLPNRPLLARVRLGLAPEVVPPRTHTLLLVRTGPGESWLADAGFGGSYVPPLRLEDGYTAETPDGARHRVRRTGPELPLDGEWMVERAGPSAATDGRAADHGEWQVQYVFDTAQVWPEDLEMGSHWTSTRSGSRFVTAHVASVVLPDGFAALSDRRLSIYRAGGKTREVREIETSDEYAQLLRETFGIALGDEEAAALPLFR